jgi:hypothetical protein
VLALDGGAGDGSAADGSAGADASRADESLGDGSPTSPGIRSSVSRADPMLSAGSAGTASAAAPAAASAPAGPSLPALSVVGPPLAAASWAAAADVAAAGLGGHTGGVTMSADLVSWWLSAPRSSSSCPGVMTVGEALPEPSGRFVRLSKPSSYDPDPQEVISRTRRPIDTNAKKVAFFAETPRQPTLMRTLLPPKSLPSSILAHGVSTVMAFLSELFRFFVGLVRQIRRVRGTFWSFLVILLIC